MPVTNEERTLEVLGVPEAVDKELLILYFSNKPHSGGGPLVSVVKRGGQAFVVFEEAEAAARVLSKEHHVLAKTEITVRRPATAVLLLRGVQPNTCMDLVELYVENVMELDEDDYTLTLLPSMDAILIRLHKPLATDFYSLSANISKRPLKGSKITLEEIEQTDSILVENLHPGISVETLTLHFEGGQASNQKVKEVVMLSETTARVSFVHFDTVDHVLNHPHKLNDATLIVSPYYVFNQPAACQAQSHPSQGSQSVNVLDSVPTRATSTPVESIDNQSIATVDSNMEEIDIVDGNMETIPEVRPEMHSVELPVQDLAKLSLFQMSTLPQVHQTHPNVDIQIKDNDIYFTGTDRPALEHLRTTVVNFLSGMAQSVVAVDNEEARFLERPHVRESLQKTFSQLGITTVYAVSNNNTVVMTSMSPDMASQACVSLRAQLCSFCIPVERDYECMLYSQEWSAFLQTLGSCSARVSEDGANVAVVTLRGLENEMLGKVIEFLLTPIQQEKFIAMKPGMLKYVQMYFHQLMADMNQVVIVLVEGTEICGLRIQGLAGHCQNAQELLESMISSVYTRTITVNQSGVARFLVETEGTGILNEMRAKFQICITLNEGWAPLQNQDIFKAAWKHMSLRNFQKVESACTAARSLYSASTENGALGQGNEEEEEEDSDNVDLYTAGDTEDFGEAMALGAAGVGPSASATGLEGGGAAMALEEDQQLSLAIQNSLCSTTEDDELQRVLELSKQQGPYSSYQIGAQQSTPRCLSTLLEDMQAADVGQVHVFAGFSNSLICADIALRKKVTLRQVEEKLQQKGLSNMSEFHRQCVNVIKRKHAVEIQAQGDILTVSGFKDFVDEALPNARLLLRRISSRRDESELLRNIQWARQEPGAAGATPYEPDTIVFIENIWRMKEKEMAILVDGQPRVVDLIKMQEYNVASGESVSIVRTVLSDVDIEHIVQEEGCSLLSNLPDVYELDKISEEFQEVVKSFNSTLTQCISKIRIIKVEKMENRLLYNQYKLKKASIYQSGTDNDVERTLYHGTSEASVKEIYVHGFNRSFCGKNATVYGKGVYFALNSSLSVQDQYSPPNADGHKFIFVAKVLTGDYTEGSGSMKAAPLKENADIPLRYDSVTDSLSKPTMFVIFNDTQAYPEYLITCQIVPR